MSPGQYVPWYDSKVLTTQVNFEYIFEEGVLIVAVCNTDGKLVSFTNEPVSLNDFQKTVRLEADENYLDYNVKVMFWNGLGTIKPIAVSFESNVTEVDFITEILESAHPYNDSSSETYLYTYDGDCVSIDVTFTEDTYTEFGYDKIIVYDATDTLIGVYSGAQLAGVTLNIPGNTVKILFTTDGSVSYYGFKTKSIVVNK